jgi:surface carbohydrate biosynthesis protein
MRLRQDLPTVLLPIETAVRELDSKLVMASVLAGQGCRAIVGHKEIISSIGRASKGVVWLGKSLFISPSDDYVADRLLDNGSAIMHLHEEGGVYPLRAWTDHFLYRLDFEKLTQRDISRACLWGEKQKAVLGTHSVKLANVAVVTGHPRFDLCSPSFAWLTDGESQKVPAAFHPYILTCSRFGLPSHAEGPGRPFERQHDPRVWPRHLDIFEEWRQDMHDFAEFVVMVKELAVSFPQYTVVVRPHPSENMTFFKQAFATFRNVVVRRDGSVLSWVRPAELVVHSNCTTGIEAVLAGVPTVNFLPAGRNRAEIDKAVAREAGATARNIPDVLATARQLLSGGSLAFTWSEDAVAVLNNLRIDAVPLLTRETLAVLSERRIDSSRIAIPRESTLKRALRRVVKGSSTDAYVASKRGRLNAEHVEMVIDGCRTKSRGAGLVRQLTASYTVIEPT